MNFSQLFRRLGRTEQAVTDRPERGHRKIPLAAIDALIKTDDEPETPLTREERALLDDFEPEFAAAFSIPDED